MKYIEREEIEIRLKKAMELTGTTEDFNQAYTTRLTKINKFIETFGTEIPTIREMRKYKGLLSDRTIQRVLGGVPFFRAFIQGVLIDYTKGEERKNITQRVSERSRVYQRDVYDTLTAEYGFENVHPQRPYVIGEKKRCSFYIVPKDVYIECFHTEYTAQTIISYKQGNLKEFKDTHKIFYIENKSEMKKLW